MSFVHASGNVQPPDEVNTQSADAFARLAAPGPWAGGAMELRQEVEEYFDGHVDVRAGDVVVDVGANVGAFALEVALRTGSAARLICVEPAARTFSALDANFRAIEALRQTPHVLVPIALGAERDHGHRRELFFFSRLPCDTTLDLAAKRKEFERYFAARGASAATRLEKHLPGSLGAPLARLAQRVIAGVPRRPLTWWLTRLAIGMRRERVEVRTLGSLLRRESIEHVDLLKVDVEGAELDVLDGLGRSGLTRVRQVAIETVSERSEHLERMLREGGFVSVRARPTANGVARGLRNVLVTATRVRCSTAAT